MILCAKKTLAELASDTTNGLGTLQCIDPIVTEELNGGYELEFDILITDPHFEDLEVGSVLKTTANDHDGLQMFKVYSISKEINGKCTIHAEHISYELSKVPVSPFSSTGAVLSVNSLMGHIIGSTPFTISTDIENTTSVFTLDIPRSFRECLGGYEGSLLDVFRGEYHWDNLEVEMLSHRGNDNGVRIAYGKNLTDLKQEENIESVYTSVLGYAVVDEVCYVGTVYDKVQGNKVLIVDFSGDYESGDVPTSAELTTKAQTYAENHDIEVPRVSLNVSFIHLWQTEEYKDVLPIERVSLGDTVHVFFDKLGVEANARVIKTVWSPNLERYISIELGSARANLNTILNDVENETIETIKSSIDIDTSSIENEMTAITNLIVNGVGLHKSVGQNGIIYLHNEESLAQSQYQYRISSGGFELSDDYGQTWNSGWDISGHAVMNALSTITLRALEIYGSYIQGSQIVFGDPSIQGAKYIVAEPYSNGVTFDGTGTIRLQPQEAFYINNTDGNNHNYNQIFMDKNGSNSNLISLTNRDETKGFALANQLQLQAHNNNQADLKNILIAYNYATVTEDNVYKSYLANYLELQAFEDRNYLYLHNRKSKSLLNANYLSFSALASLNSANIINRSFAADVNANRIYMGSSATQNSSELTNNKLGVSTIANEFTLVSNQTNNFISSSNKALSADRTANMFVLRAYSSQHNAELLNYRNVSGGYYANRLYLSENGTTNYIGLVNYKANNTDNLNEHSNSLEMYGYASNSGRTNQFIMYNYDIDGNNVANRIAMSKSSNMNEVAIGIAQGGDEIAHLLMQRNGNSVMAEVGLTGLRYNQAKIVFTEDGAINIWGSSLYFNGNPL